jgi:hypothetical protein
MARPDSGAADRHEATLAGPISAVSLFLDTLAFRNAPRYAAGRRPVAAPIPGKNPPDRAGSFPAGIDLFNP